VITISVLAWAGLVAACATRILPKARWVYRSPGLGLCAWWSVLAVVVLSVPAAVTAALLGWSGTRSAVCAWWTWCMRAAQGAYGPAGRLLAVGVGLVLLVLAARAAGAGWRAGRTLAERRRRYGPLLAAGRARRELGATVVEHPVAAAFVVPGRPRRVVVTTGALEVLPAEQVAAVLDHERAHAAGHHQLLADTARLLAAALPGAAVFARAREQVDRMVEMRADDVAARRHARLDLARALVAMAQAGQSSDGLVPTGVVAATGARASDAVERVRRLLQPPVALPDRVRLAAGAGLVGLALTPVVLVVVAGLVPTLAGCLPMG
jgi:Zn-dependent protease with chaperone function